MKKMLFTLIALLAMASAQAQDENAAFYIYQNDGHFDGFFYDQVQKISYSKLDTLGVEHDDYVSQEIQTADSVYRIMLTAIDSVGFVQPEVKLNPRLRNMREEGMNAYLTQKDAEALTLTFASSMPEALRPHEGDVLVDFDIEDGFGGKAKSVSSSGGQISVVCDTIGMRDVFMQFITVEQQDENKNGQLIRRRTAGMPKMDIDNRAMLRVPFRSEGNFEGNIFNFGFSGHLVLLDSADVSLTVDANINSALTIKGSYNIPVVGPYYIGLTFQNDLDFGLGLTVDAKLNEMKERETPFKASLPIPAACPIFELRSVPGFFLKGDAHMKFAADLVKYRKRVWHKLEFNNDWLPTFNFGDAQLPELDDAIDKPWERDASIEFNGTIMAGIHGPLELGINSWLRKVLDASFGIHMYVGPKLSGALNFSLSNMYKDKMSVYNLLKDSKLSLQPCAFDYEATAELNTWFSGKKKVTLADGSASLMGDIEVYAFPEFSLDVSGDSFTDAWGEIHGLAKATLEPSRNLFFPVQVGVGLFDKETSELLDYHMADDAEVPMLDYWQFSNEWKERKSVDLKWVTSPGEYTARPIFRLYGWDVVAAPAKDVTVPGPYLRVSPDTLYFDCDGSYKGSPLKIKTNLYPWIRGKGGANDWKITGSDKEWTVENPKWPDVNSPINYSLYDRRVGRVEVLGSASQSDAENGEFQDMKSVMLIQKPNRTYLPNRIGINGLTEDGHLFDFTSPEIPPHCSFVNDSLLHVSCNGTTYGTHYGEERPEVKFSCNFNIEIKKYSLKVDKVTYEYEEYEYNKVDGVVYSKVHHRDFTTTNEGCQQGLTEYGYVLSMSLPHDEYKGIHHGHHIWLDYWKPQE